MLLTWGSFTNVSGIECKNLEEKWSPCGEDRYRTKLPSERRSCVADRGDIMDAVVLNAADSL